MTTKREDKWDAETHPHHGRGYVLNIYAHDVGGVLIRTRTIMFPDTGTLMSIPMKGSR